LKWLSAERPYNLLLIGKTGADINKSEDSCRVDEFQHSSVRSQRIKDNQTIMHDLIPANARILLAGISEGAYIAPDVAYADSRVKAYLDLSGNTQSWMTEEIMCVPEGPQRDKLEKFFDTEVRGNNSFTKYYVDWTYAYLNSYDTHRSYDMMKALNIPIAWLNGDHDETLWVEGARLDAMDLINNQHKTNIEYHWLAGANHGLQCADSAKGCDDKALADQVRTIITTFAAKHF
jgi:pimeloyl-ACP methyl ester carboxylesterase